MSKKPVVLIIRDGWGVNPGGRAKAVENGDATLLARTPFHDQLYAKYPQSRLSASGMDVGLPDGQMGNSEVGHLNLGAGRIVYQDLTRIREDMGLAYFVGSSNLMGLAPGAFSFYAGTDPAKIAEVKSALSDEIRKLAEEGITPAELDRAKAKLLGAHEIRNQSNDALAFACALDELYGLGFRHHDGLRARGEAVTFEQVREVARRYFSQASVTAIVRPA